MRFKTVLFSTFLAATTLLFTACEKETEEILVDSNLPQGMLTISKSGSIIEQNATGSKGAVQLGTDTEGVQFVKFGTDFQTVLATGTVTVYLSTSKDYVADPANGNPNLRLIGIVQKNGEQYFKLDPNADARFTHLILWCGSATIPFGFASLN
ncbi:MAG: hypothetical protein SH848_18305 [Saprospiraceae bacterium]|nr:hypothetical protein [Saprospiraceae bacterium]MDZ4705885.1 hypothetical protein [Saprospiraceae bacterium]